METVAWKEGTWFLIGTSEVTSEVTKIWSCLIHTNKQISENAEIHRIHGYFHPCHHWQWSYLPSLTAWDEACKSSTSSQWAMLTVLRFLWSALLLLLAIYVVAIYITQVGQRGLGMMSTCLAVEVCWWVCRETWRVDLKSMKFFPRWNRWTESCNWDSVNEWVDQSFKKSVAGGIIPSTFFLFPKISPWNLDLWYTGFETLSLLATHFATDAYEENLRIFSSKSMESNCLSLFDGRQRQPSAWKMLKLSLQSRSSDRNRGEIAAPSPKLDVEVKESISCWLGIKEQLLSLGW